MKCRQTFRVFHLGSIVLAVVFSTMAAAQPASPQPDGTLLGLDSPDRIPGEYIVVLKEAPIRDYLETLPAPQRRVNV